MLNYCFVFELWLWWLDQVTAFRLRYIFRNQIWMRPETTSECGSSRIRKNRIPLFRLFFYRIPIWIWHRSSSGWIWLPASGLVRPQKGRRILIVSWICLTTDAAWRADSKCTSDVKQTSSCWHSIITLNNRQWKLDHHCDPIMSKKKQDYYFCGKDGI